MKHFHYTFGLLLLCILFALPAAAESTPVPDEVKLVYSRFIDVPGVGEWYYYAQNDPEWDASIYEPYKNEEYRRFGDAGCGPTSLAIALSRQLQPEDLATIVEHKNPHQDGYYYCPCSVNTYHCYNRHESILIETPEDYRANLPLVMGAYAAGNNDDQFKYRSTSDGTSLAVFKAVAEDYGLEYRGTNDWSTAYQALQDGYSVITTVTKGIFTPASHYMVVAHADEEFIYILDPLMREEYNRDTKHRLEVIEPGLLRAKAKDFNKLGLYGFYMMKKVDSAAQVE